MTDHLRQATLNEIFKLIKHKTTYVYIAIVLAIILASSFGIKFFENTSTTNNGYSYVIFSLQTLSTTILPFILLMFSTNTVSSEKASGTIRNILVCGCSKTEFILSKLISSFVFLLILMTISAIVAIIAGYLLFGFGPLNEDGLTIMTQSQFWIQFLISYSLLGIVLFSIISFGIMISTMIQTTISAIAVAIGSYIVLEAIKTKLHIDNYLYSSYIEFPLDKISNMIEGFRGDWAPKIYYCLGASIVWIFVTSMISIVMINKSEYK